MENVVIGNATYVVSRVFVGNQNVSELIQKRMEANSSQLLSLCLHLIMTAEETLV